MKLEADLWSQGIETWDDFDNHINFIRNFLSPVFFEEEFLREIQQAKINYEKKNIRYFWDRFPYSEAWRIFGDFPEFFWALDIETTGLEYPHKITCICVSNGLETYQFTRSRNLEEFYEFWNAIPDGILVTYNGFRFDLPFLKRDMQWISPIPHLDLMHVLHKMNIKGGLKKSEETLGIRRNQTVHGITGNEAVKLWNQYVLTDLEEYLRLLEEYNRADTENLIEILKRIYKIKKETIFPPEPLLSESWREYGKK